MIKVDEKRYELVVNKESNQVLIKTKIDYNILKESNLETVLYNSNNLDSCKELCKYKSGDIVACFDYEIYENQDINVEFDNSYIDPNIKICGKSLKDENTPKTLIFDGSVLLSKETLAEQEEAHQLFINSHFEMIDSLVVLKEQTNKHIHTCKVKNSIFASNLGSTLTDDVANNLTFSNVTTFNNSNKNIDLFINDKNGLYLFYKKRKNDIGNKKYNGYFKDVVLGENSSFSLNVTNESEISTRKATFIQEGVLEINHFKNSLNVNISKIVFNGKGKSEIFGSKIDILGRNLGSSTLDIGGSVLRSEMIDIDLEANCNTLIKDCQLEAKNKISAYCESGGISISGSRLYSEQSNINIEGKDIFIDNCVFVTKYGGRDVTIHSNSMISDMRASLDPEDIDEKRKAFNFDLDTNKLKQYHPSGNDTQAYKEIESFLSKYGFSHRQGSGYVSTRNVMEAEGISVVVAMNLNFDWFCKCVKKFDMTYVGREFDMRTYITDLSKNKQPDNKIEKERKRINDIDF